MKKVSLVIPMYYEEEVAEECYERVVKNLKELKDYEYEIVFVNDGSKDKTLEILENIAKKDNNVKVISFSRNFGQQAAVTCGLKYVTGDAVVIMDADLHVRMLPMDVVRALERLHLVDVDVCLAFSRGRQIRRFALFVDFGMLDRAFDGIFQCLVLLIPGFRILEDRDKLCFFVSVSRLVHI